MWGKERRAEQRHDAIIRAHIFSDGGQPQPVRIGDITGSGAMVIVSNPPEEGEKIELQIEGFGNLKATVAYSGDGVCGVMFMNAIQHRDRLLQWIKQQLLNAHI